MITTKSKNIILKFLAEAFAAVLLFLPAVSVLATTATDCDPWPTDTDLILNCIDYNNTNPQSRVYDPGTDPAHPTALPFSGMWGLDAAYSPRLDKVLVVSSESTASPDLKHIKGVLADPKTLAVSGASFQIDQARDMFRGTPKAIYNPDADNFFVVWEDSRPSGTSRSTYARIISGSGLTQGKEILVTSGVTFLSDVAYDPTNHKYIVLSGTDHPIIKTVTQEGVVDSKAIPVSNVHSFEGFSSVAVNSNLNEYWVTYAATLTGGDTPSEDDRVYLQRINAATGVKVGSPVQLSQTRLGHNAFADTQIKYDPTTKSAVAVWMERGRDGSTAGVWGMPINEDGSLGSEFPVLTTSTLNYSEGYGLGTLSYSPYSDTFFMSSGDWNGGIELVEFDANGLVYDQNQVIAPTCADAGCGTFNHAMTVTKGGTVEVGNINHRGVAGTSHVAIGSPPAAPVTVNSPAEPGKIDFGSMGQLVSQIYVWSLGVAAVLALLMIVVGGYITLTAAGNASRATQGLSYITSSLIGLALLFGSYILLRTINPDLVTFPTTDTTQNQK